MKNDLFLVYLNFELDAFGGFSSIKNLCNSGFCANFTLNLDWKLLRMVSKIDRFDASWTSTVNNAGAKSGTIAEKRNIPRPTVKKMFSKMETQNSIEKFGIGAGTNYVVNLHYTIYRANSQGVRFVRIEL